MQPSYLQSRFVIADAHTPALQNLANKATHLFEFHLVPLQGPAASFQLCHPALQLLNLRPERRCRCLCLAAAVILPLLLDDLWGRVDEVCRVEAGCRVGLDGMGWG